MQNEISMPLSKIIEKFSLEKVFMPKNGEDIQIHNTDVNRPGLPLVGFYDNFDKSRIQILGKAEHSFLEGLDNEKRTICFEHFCKQNIPAIIVTRKLEIFDEMLESAKKYNIPLLRTKEQTSMFMSEIIYFLNAELGPRTTIHGVLVEVYGEGILLCGESGVGKSETAMELIKRGHRLIADDAVTIKRTSSRVLTGFAPEIIQYFIELRGIGIVNVKRLFGVGAVKESCDINMAVNMEPWDKNKTYDRLGLDTEFKEILDIKLPCVTIPVKPGRNLAIILEVAAMNNRQKRMGYNAAADINDKLMENLK